MTEKRNRIPRASRGVQFLAVVLGIALCVGQLAACGSGFTGPSKNEVRRLVMSYFLPASVLDFDKALAYACDGGRLYQRLSMGDIGGILANAKYPPRYSVTQVNKVKKVPDEEQLWDASLNLHVTKIPTVTQGGDFYEYSPDETIDGTTVRIKKGSAVGTGGRYCIDDLEFGKSSS